MTSPSLEHRVIGPAFAVEFPDIDLADLSDGDFAVLRDLWLEHKVAVFRDQDLSDDELVRFTERFGPLFVHVRAQFNDAARPEVMLISNIKEDGRNLGELGDGELNWHSDQSYSATPVFATLLYAIETPSAGGATWFCDTAGAYDALPEATKSRIAGLRQLLSIEVTVETQDISLPENQRQAMPPVNHPLVRTHPLLGRKSLYLSPSHMLRLDGLPAADGEALLGELLRWATGPDFVYRHDWRVGDLVLFDNCSTMHRRDAFDPAERRLLKRTGFEFPPDQAVPF